MDNQPASQIIFLTIGLEDELKAILTSNNIQIQSIDSLENYEKLIDSPPDIHFLAVFCGQLIKDLKTLELAQSIKMQFLNIPTYFVTQNRDNYERKNFIKNGFDEAFLLPLDREHLQKTLTELISQADPKSGRLLRPVKLIDIEADSKLDFDVSLYLSANNKFIRYTNAGDTLNNDRIEKLNRLNYRSIYVALDQLPKFYDYTADRLRKLGDKSTGLSETEREERLQHAVRDLITEILKGGDSAATIQEGRSIVADTQEVVNKYIAKGSPDSWYQKLSQVMQENNDPYSRAIRVSNYAALFAIGLEHPRPEELAVGGLYMDLGLADIPDELLKKPESSWSKDEKELYQLHPEATMKIMRERKLIIPQSVQTAILQHHERLDGTGFPKKITGNKFSVEGQILALADRFEGLTSMTEGKRRLTPQEAFKEISKEKIMEPQNLQKVSKMLPEK